MSRLDERVAFRRARLAALVHDHPDRVWALDSLGTALSTWFEQLGGLLYLEEAITLYRSVLELRPEGHRHRHSSLNKLANSLLTRFMNLGGMADLDEAIALHRSALELRPEGHPHRHCSLNNLANSLQTRFKNLGGVADLNEAITLYCKALDLRPQGHPKRSMSLNNLANSLQTRFLNLGVIADLDESVTLHRRALELRPKGHPYRHCSLNNLANSLKTRFKNSGRIADIEEAITLHRSALDLRPHGHPCRSSSLNDLANSLKTRFEKVGGIADLDEAITLHGMALDLRPQGHPDRSSSVRSAASCLLQHPHASSERNEEAFALYSTLEDVSQSVVASDLNAAQDWVRAAEKVGHHTTPSAYQTSLRLLASHFAALPCLPQHLEILKSRLSSLPMDAFSASIRHHTLTNAVELLEQGRGVFWSQLTRLRSPVGDVIASGDEGRRLGEKFLSVSRELRGILDSNLGDDCAWHVTNRLRETVDEIRRLPGHSRFLLPPLFSDLRNAASGGPVIIINASQYGCDALIVYHDGDPIHIPLQIRKADVRRWSLDLGTITKKGRSQDVTTDLVKILRELWDKVVCPVVEVLKTLKVPLQSRVWWCPTAEFALLPLHAAGEYRSQKPKFSDLYISSYTPTLSALLRSRRPLPPTTQDLRFLAIGNGETPGQPNLEHVHEELISVREFVDPHATFTSIEGHETQVGRIREQLQQCEFVHFACHGIPKPAKPFESGFALVDGLLKIEHIMHYDLQHSRLATLSACHATVGDKDSPDEAINPAAAMQFIGFRSVVGTMWGVDDQVAKGVMTELYRHIVGKAGCLDHTLSAVALHEALRAVKPKSLLQRILFVHIGA